MRTRTTFYVTVSAVLSLLLHLLFLGAAGQLGLAAFWSQLPEYPPPEMRLRVQTVDIRERVMRPPPEPSVADVVKELAESVRANDLVRDIFAKQDLLPKLQPELRLTGLGRNVLAPQLPTATPPQEATAPRPNILAIDMQDLPMDRRPLQRQLTPKLARQDMDSKHLPSLLSPGGASASVGRTIEVGMRLNLPPGGRLPGDGLPFDSGLGDGAGGGFGPNAPRLPGSIAAEGGRTQALHDLDSLMSVSMVARAERTGGGTFRIDIKPNPRSDMLRSVPKDTLFLIDCSTSISPAMLEQFRIGVIEALPYLNRADRFNVASFRERADTLFDDYVDATPENIATAIGHVRALIRGGMTDVFAGLSPFVGLQSKPDNRPLNIFLLSDGQSTVRGKLQDEVLIREIVALNRANVSIYSFSAGSKANLFLLDFLAYHNRGSSRHKREIRDFKDQLIRFLGTHSELIVADLNYQITGGMRESVFPKRLPHLYRGETLSIYGRYPPEAEQIALSIVGRDADGELAELIFRGNVKTCPRADAALESDWAAQHVYHLIGVRTLAPSPEIDAQIRSLALKYNLYVPY